MGGSVSDNVGRPSYHDRSPQPRPNVGRDSNNGVTCILNFKYSFTKKRHGVKKSLKKAKTVGNMSNQNA